MSRAVVLAAGEREEMVMSEAFLEGADCICPAGEDWPWYGFRSSPPRLLPTVLPKAGPKRSIAYAPRVDDRYRPPVVLCARCWRSSAAQRRRISCCGSSKPTSG